MGVLDLATKVLVSYKGDISDLKSKLKELKGEEKALAEAQIKAAEDRNKALDGTIGKLADVGHAYNTVANFVSKAMELQAEAARKARLADAARGVDLDKLTVASHGLATQTELLSDAAEMNNGMMVMSSKQMEIAERSIVSFTRKGFEHAKAHEAIMKAVTTLKVDGLDDLGLHIDKSGLSMDSARDRAKLYERVMGELAKTSGDVKDGQDLASEGMSKASISMVDSFDKIKTALGELADSMAPLLKGLASAVSLIADIVKGAREYAKKNPLGFVLSVAAGGGGQMTGEALDRAGEAGAFSTKNFAGGMASVLSLIGIGSRPNMANYGGVDGNPGAIFGTPTAAGGAQAGAPMTLDLRTNSTKLSNDQAKALSDAAKKYASDVMKTVTDELITQLENEIESGDTGGWKRSQWREELRSIDIANAGRDRASDGMDMNAINDRLSKFNGAGGDLEGRIADTKRESVLERMFGKKEEFDQYRELFSGLSGSILAAYTAVVDGTMSAGDAAKTFAKAWLSSLGQRLLFRGTEEFAEGVASAAIPGGQASAAGHFAAAALFGAGAAAAGIASHAISAPSSSGGGSSAPQVSRGGGGDSNGPRSAVIVVGDSFADDSPRMRQIRARELVQRAIGGGGGRNE